MNKLFIIAKFNARWPDVHNTPVYQEVKTKDPELFEAIMDRFGGYRAFCRQTHRCYPPTTPREDAFRRYSSACSRRYFRNRWSSLEESVWAVLEYLDLANDFIHNFPFPSPKGSYYKIDFFNPWILARIEVDGIFHQALPKQAERDVAKDEYFLRYGIQTLHLTGRDVHSLRLIDKIVGFIIACQNRRR